MLWDLDFLRTNPKYLTLRLNDARRARREHFLLQGSKTMGCCCNNTKDDKNQSPDCMASKSTVVTTPEGEDVEVNFNMGTGEVTYGKKTGCCSDKSDGTSSGGCGCSK